MSALLYRFFGDGFRVFFLAAGAFALFAVGFWLMWLGVHWAGGMFTSLPFTMAPHIWHGHELIFGYGAATLAGFLLTAVPNWTGTKAARHAFIAFAAAVWLLGRIAVWSSASIPPIAVAIVDLVFLPILTIKIATQLAKRPKPQNLMFIGLLGIVWTANLMVHLEWMGITADTASAGLRGGLYGLCAMIAVIGGRVTPAFTRNAMMREGRPSGYPVSHRPLELSGVALAMVLPIAVMVRSPDVLVGVLFMLTGAIFVVRVAGWGIGFALRQPILWSLHLGFAQVGIGMVLTGLALLGFGSEVAALHVTAIGGVAGMTVAVMSRATLGHTGRPLVAPPTLVLAYVLLPASGVVRWAASAAAGAFYFPAIFIAGILWLAAFAAYVTSLWPAFWGPGAQGGD